jgi:hypothetical protein
MADEGEGNSDEMTGKGQAQLLKWNEVKKARNRINSQRTRERERSQIDTLEAERARLLISNDAIRYQNNHFRNAIQQVQANERARSVSLGHGASLSVAMPAPSQTVSSTSRMTPEASRALQLSLPSAAQQLLHRPGVTQAQELAYAAAVAERGGDFLARHRHASALFNVQNMASSLHPPTRSAAIGAFLGTVIPPSSDRDMLQRTSLLNQSRTIDSASTPAAVMLPFDMADARTRQLMMQASNLEASMHHSGIRTASPPASARDDPRRRSLREDDTTPDRDPEDSTKRRKYRK